ncbi:hypothetical protein [Methylobacter sp.]|uniref:hypothetical protein n=1 Tax=Methylobacter sp. TaxID=2051955 RepID=UPI003DA5D4EF
MEVKSIFNSSFEKIDSVSIGICRPKKRLNQQHIGLLYRDANNDLCLLHLAWHLDLRKNNPDIRYLWLDIHLDPINKIHLATICEMIYESNQEGIPYGICIDGTGLSKDGVFSSDENYAGLTCATFVIQVLHSQGIYIIDLEKWKHKKADKCWQLQILQNLQNIASKEHIQYQRKKIQEGAARFKPEEVAVAASLPNRPHGPDALKKPANKLLNLIIEHTEKIANLKNNIK